MTDPMPAWVHTGTAMRAMCVKPELWADRMKDVGFSGAVLTLNSIFKKGEGGKLLRKWSPLGTPDKVAAVGATMQDRGLDVDVMVYPHPGDLARLETELSQRLIAL